VIAELEIDLDAIRRNVVALAELVAPAGYAAVIKSNAYGHGLVPVARAVENDVAAFCVYGFEEAATLRESGITTPVLVLGPVDAHDLAGAAERDITIAVWSDGAFLRDATRASLARGRRLRVHAKIDTGVTRLGLDADRAAGTIANYLASGDLELAGVFTHLAAAEELESNYTLGQLERFETALAPLDGLLAERRVVRHAAASAAAMLYPKLRLDLVRAGIATYGIWPSQATRDAAGGAIALEPALTWTSELVVVREVEAGRSVGYGCTFHTTRPSRIGVVPIGYAEGIPRAASSRGIVLVAGRRVPLVGRICMNMCFVDVTDAPQARAGSRVTLIGRDGDASIDANEFAETAGTIGYEIVARLPAGVPRRYVSERADVHSAASAIAAARSIVPS
jgi:alanine racemase